MVNSALIVITTGMCTHTDLSLTGMVCSLQKTHGFRAEEVGHA